ncbi:bifunctional [glutamate--ammonia ligase]-adenylyl-L-tyrosine phosphorylase/[glutamate--ammonia-ligase] adenylyltransferase, partial [Vibrio astriarenae]
TLPDSEDERLKLAIAMRFAHWDDLAAQTQQHMANVHHVFESLIGDDEEDETEAVARHFHELWDMATKQDVIELVLQQDIKVERSEELAKIIMQFKADLAKKTLGPRGREVLTKLMPKVFSAVFA